MILAPDKTNFIDSEIDENPIIHNPEDYQPEINSFNLHINSEQVKTIRKVSIQT